MLLVDSSVIILIEHGDVRSGDLDEDEDFAICPAVAQEILQGATTAAIRSIIDETLGSFIMLDSPTPLTRFQEAARLFVACRRLGFTAGGYDCLIAATAIAHGAELLHSDEDFEFIAQAAPALRQQRL